MGTHTVDVSSYTNMAIPRENGRLYAIADGFNSGNTDTYPSREQWGQFMIFIGASSMLLVYTTDTTGAIQKWRVASNTLTITYYTDSLTKVEVVVAGTNWRDAADIYKAWASQQWWYQRKPLTGTQDIKHIMTGATNAGSYLTGTLLPIAKHYEERVGWFMSQYRDSAFDVNYPDYTPRAAGNFPAAWKTLLDDNHVLLPYINGILWDTTNVEYSAGYMAEDSGGNPYVYGAGNLRYVCPYQASWATKLRTEWAALQDSDSRTLGGVYLDVVASAQPRLCYSSSHGHAAQSPTSWFTGVVQVLTAFSDVVTLAEGVAEVYIPYVDMDLRFLNMHQSYAIPLWSYIYGDVARSVGAGGLSTSADAGTIAAELLTAHQRAMSTFGHYCAGPYAGQSSGLRMETLLNGSAISLVSADLADTLRIVADKTWDGREVERARGRRFVSQEGADGGAYYCTLNTTSYGIKVSDSGAPEIKGVHFKCSSGYCIDVDAGCSVTSDYNHYDHEYTAMFRGADGTTYDTVADWTRETGQDAHSTVGTRSVGNGLQDGVWIAGVRAADDLPLPLHPDRGSDQDRSAPGRRFGSGGGKK